MASDAPTQPDTAAWLLMFVDDPDDPAWDLLAPHNDLHGTLAQLPNLPARIIDMLAANPHNHVVLARNASLGVERLAALRQEPKVCAELAGNPAWFAAHTPDPGSVAAAMRADPAETPTMLLAAAGLDPTVTDVDGPRLARALFANHATTGEWVEQALVDVPSPLFKLVVPLIAGRTDVSSALLTAAYRALLGERTKVRETLSANPTISAELAAKMAKVPRAGWTRIMANPAIPAGEHTKALSAATTFVTAGDDNPLVRVFRNPLTAREVALEIARDQRASSAVVHEACANPNLTVADLAGLAAGDNLAARTAAAELRRRREWAGFRGRWANLAADQAWAIPNHAPEVAAHQLTAIVELAAGGVSPAAAVAASALM